jgi:sulfate adenylyltransferase subunit 2
MNFLEAESIEIIREGVATARTPVMMYSIGKDSSVMLQLARKAFYSGLPPFPLLHIDTGWKFQAMYQHRGCVVAESGMTLITHINQQGLADGVGPFTHGSSYHTDVMKTQALKQALDANGFDLGVGRCAA